MIVGSIRGLALLISTALWAADVTEILQRSIDAQSKNWERASQYAYVEHADFYGFDKNGQPRKDRSETNEIVFVEGSTYKKLIARNERALEGKEKAKEEKKMQRTAEERRRQRHAGAFHKEVSAGSDADALTLFDNRLVGEEEIRGRKVWVIECTPKSGRVPANAHEKEVLSFQRKLWIDQSELILLRSVYTVVGEHIVFMPGSTIRWDFEKIHDDAWLATSGAVDGRLQFVKLIKPRVRTEYRNSSFQKFDVQSTITMDPK